MPETPTDIQADLPQSSIPKPTEEDHLIKELHIQYGNLQTNMSPLCIVLQNDLVYLWRNEVHTILKTPSLTFLFSKYKPLFQNALSVLLPSLNNKKKFTKYLKKSHRGRPQDIEVDYQQSLS